MRYDLGKPLRFEDLISAAVCANMLGRANVAWLFRLHLSELPEENGFFRLALRRGI